MCEKSTNPGINAHPPNFRHHDVRRLQRDSPINFNFAFIHCGEALTAMEEVIRRNSLMVDEESARVGLSFQPG